MPVFNQEQYRPALHAALKEMSTLIFDSPDFSTASFRFADPIGPGENRELGLRLVQIGDDTLWQSTRAGNAENRGRGTTKKTLWELINSSNILLEAHASAADGTAIHLRTTRKGHVLLDRVRPQKTPAAEIKNGDTGHDHQKNYPLRRFDSEKLLIALGFASHEGTLKPTMQANYRQVNEFLRIVDAVLDELPPRRSRENGKPLCLVDCGCGKAYLSFAAKAYIEAIRNIPVQLVGIDRKADVIAFCRRTAETLEMADSCTFAASDIASYKPAQNPDIVLSLHACDTATDDALAFGVEQNARAILCAPCCQHELQKALSAQMRPHRAILRNGILRERLADILTDSFRAQILRVLGFRATVVEFVDSEATARNILIRAARVSRPGTGTALSDYEDLREAWGVTPYLAKRLAHLEPALAPDANADTGETAKNARCPSCSSPR